MATIPADASKGLVSSRDPSTLRPGELAEATGLEYRIGSPHAYKQLGRTSTHNSLNHPVQALARLQYDTDDTVIVAVANGTVYESTDSITPSFIATPLTGLSASATPQFVGYNERWLMCNGVDANRIREPAVPPGGTTGHWRLLGLQPPATPLSYTISTAITAIVRPTTDSAYGSFSYVNPAYARDGTNVTFALGAAATATTDIIHNGRIWKFTTNFAVDACTLYIDHEGPLVGVLDSASIVVEYSLNAGSQWFNITNTHSFARRTDSITLTNGTTMANQLWVRAYVGNSSGVVVYLNHLIYDIRVSGGGAAYTPDPTTGVSVYYGLTEIYTDSDGVEHESVMGNVNSNGPSTFLTTTQLSTATSVTFTLPTSPVNSLATNYGVYRSIDEPGGGYPFMYRVGNPKVTDTTWVDDFSDIPNTVPDKQLLQFFQVTFPTGEVLPYEFAAPPPLAKLVLSFQGVMIYTPVSTDLAHRLYYSVASTISIAGIEQVPTFQYLDFQSPRNDSIVSAVVTNGGRSLLVFFASYTMLVNYLPQSSDGVFDNRIKEYVSNNRGTSGRLTCCEFTLPAGQTLVASVDALGLWVTNGVNQMDEWSRDLDWATAFAGIDLTVAQLVDNTAKRRLELLYTDATGARAEHHFFYGRLKEDGDGKPGPLITGPHPSSVQCKHYCQIANSWVGLSGDASATGDVFIEESGAADEAADDQDITWEWELGDVYPHGLSRASILETITVKFQDGNTKEYTATVTLIRDNGNERAITKTFTGNTSLYIHAYCDRFRIKFTDTSHTAASAFVGIESMWRDAGPNRQ